MKTAIPPFRSGGIISNPPIDSSIRFLQSQWKIIIIVIINTPLICPFCGSSADDRTDENRQDIALTSDKGQDSARPCPFSPVPSSAPFRHNVDQPTSPAQNPCADYVHCIKECLLQTILISGATRAPFASNSYVIANFLVSTLPR